MAAVVFLSISAFFIVGKSQFMLAPFKLPTKISGHGAGIYNDTFTIINGWNGDSATWRSGSVSISLTPKVGEWENNSYTLPMSLQSIQYFGDNSVQIDNLVYSANADIYPDEFRYRTMFIFDLSLNQYTASFAVPNIARLPCVAANKGLGIIYVIGGGLMADRFPHTQSYDITSGTWTLKSNINIARQSACCAIDVTNTNIFLFSGQSTSATFLSSIEKYDISLDKWDIINQTVIVPRVNAVCKLLPYNAKIYCMGGSDDFNFLKPVEVFNPVDYSIISMQMNVGRYIFQVTLWNDNCLIISGGDSDEAHAVEDTIEYVGNCIIETLQTETPTKAPSTFPSFDPTLEPIVSTAGIVETAISDSVIHCEYSVLVIFCNAVIILNV